MVVDSSFYNKIKSGYRMVKPEHASSDVYVPSQSLRDGVAVLGFNWCRCLNSALLFVYMQLWAYDEVLEQWTREETIFPQPEWHGGLSAALGIYEGEPATSTQDFKFLCSFFLCLSLSNGFSFPWGEIIFQTNIYKYNYLLKLFKFLCAL